jgi:hypothetical protein
LKELLKNLQFFLYIFQFNGKDYKKTGGIIMSKNMLTTKEATLLSDLLIYEESACKKARLYAKCVTNKELSQKLNDIANSHQQRFNALMGLL